MLARHSLTLPARSSRPSTKLAFGKFASARTVTSKRRKNPTTPPRQIVHKNQKPHHLRRITLISSFFDSHWIMLDLSYPDREE